MTNDGLVIIASPRWDPELLHLLQQHCDRVGLQLAMMDEIPKIVPALPKPAPIAITRDKAWYRKFDKKPRGR